MSRVFLYADMPDSHCAREAPNPICRAPNWCAMHPRGKLQADPDGCAAAVKHDSDPGWHPCSNKRLDGDALCWQHARVRDRAALDAQRARLRPTPRRGTPEGFYYLERFG